MQTGPFKLLVVIVLLDMLRLDMWVQHFKDVAGETELIQPKYTDFIFNIYI